MKKATLLTLMVLAAFAFSSVAVYAAPATAIFADEKKDEKKGEQPPVEEDDQPQGMHGY